VTFWTLQKVKTEIAVNDTYDAGMFDPSFCISGVLKDMFVAGLSGFVSVHQVWWHFLTRDVLYLFL